MFLALLLAAQPSAWIPARWPSGDPKTLEIVRQTPINCLLLEEPFWSAAFSGAADEERAANRIAEQQDELDRLVAQRDKLGKK